MTTFMPLSESSTIWIDLTATSETYALPVQARSLFDVQVGCTMRLASASGAADILFQIGDETVAVDVDSAILFPAGSLETMRLGPNTHIAVMAPDAATSPTRLNITIGIGE